MLLELMAKHGIDSGMLTYAACDLASQQRLFAAFPEGPPVCCCNPNTHTHFQPIHHNMFCVRFEFVHTLHCESTVGTAQCRLPYKRSVVS